MAKYKIKIINLKTGTESEVPVLADEAETTTNIILKLNIDNNEIYAEDYNYLPAYQKIRDKMLDMNYGIKCKGSQLNSVQPEIMSACDKIYLVNMGNQAFNENIVSIFEYSDIKVFPDTNAQNDCSEKWFESIERK